MNAVMAKYNITVVVNNCIGDKLNINGIGVISGYVILTVMYLITGILNNTIIANPKKTLTKKYRIYRNIDCKI